MTASHTPGGAIDARRGDLAPGTAVGQYTVRRRIGAGGMAEVYEALHSGLNKRVAIKTLRREYADNPTLVARFLREAQVASSFRHPHIVDVTDVGIIDDLPCLVMEYLEGETLHALLKRRTSLPLAELVDLPLPVIAAVRVAHEHGVVHRDLKPANIFLTTAWTGGAHPKVLDFGISKLVAEPEPSALTTDSTFLGSPHYVSPEQARGERVLDGRADQYSIGVILYEAACGVRPFAHRAQTFMALMYAIAQGDYAPPRAHRPELPPEFEAIVLQAMQRDAAQRFPSLGEFGRALLPFASERTRLLQEPLFSGMLPSPMSSPNAAATLVDVPRATFEDSHGTLGRSVSEISSTARPLEAPRRISPVVWILAAGLVGALCLVAWGIVRVVAARSHAHVPVASAALLSPKPAPLQKPALAARPKPASSPAPAKTDYLAETKVTPDDATLELDGNKVGVGSFSTKLQLDGRKHKLSISAPGYDTVVLDFLDAPPPASVELVPVKSARPTVHRVVHAAPKSAGTPGKLHTDNRDPWAQ